MKKAKTPTQTNNTNNYSQSFQQSPPDLASMLEAIKNNNSNNDTLKKQEQNTTPYGNIASLPELPLLPQTYYSKTQYKDLMSKHDEILARIRKNQKRKK